MHDPRMIRRWMWAGLMSLAVGGLFSLLLVLARTPQIQAYIPFKDFFHTALVVHVDLTVLVWFLSNACLIWQLSMKRMAGGVITSQFAFGSMVIGMVLMAAAAFVPDAQPLLNNYVPILRTELFYLSLGFVAAGVLLMAGQAVLVTEWQERDRLFSFAAWSAGVITLLSFLALMGSKALMPEDAAGEHYYELLFWGGGHMLQFTHTQLLAWVWLTLLGALGGVMKLPRKVVWALLVGGALSVVTAVYPYARGELGDGVYLRFFTLLMIMANGWYVIPVGVAVLWGVWQRKGNVAVEMRPVLHALLASLLLFAAGGLISLRIEGVNVIIPAHYHGSIVGVSLAYMALFYWLLPQVGAPAVVGRWAVAQPWCYAVGQLLHITGLMISGGYEVARKTVQLEPGAAFGARFGMGMMGMGGLVAIIGGLLFVVLVWRSLRRRA